MRAQRPPRRREQPAVARVDDRRVVADRASAAKYSMT